MKKALTILAACAALCLAACGPTGQVVDMYDVLNDMLHADYAKIELTVKDEIDTDTVLHSAYTLYFGETVTISYRVERLGAFGSLGESLSSAVGTLVGTAELKDGDLVTTEGDVIDLSAQALGSGINFRSEYFETTELGGIFLKADVKDQAGFWGSDLHCSEMKVSAIFLDVLSELTVTYRSEHGGRVEIVYTFSV